MLIGAGYLLGTQWTRVSDAMGAVSTPILVIAGVAAAVALALWIRRHRHQHVH